MNNKTKVLCAASGTGLIGFINWLATVPPEQQSGMLAEFVELVPLQYRPQVGLATRLLMLVLGTYATFKASQTTPSK